MKKISVIIPCYNVEKYIDRCMDSVFSQAFPIEDTEVICVDDGSEDDTFQKLSDWEAKHPDNIMVIRHDDNSGQSTARNTALSYASGEYVAFIDADDWIDARYLKSMYDIAVSGDYDIVQCDYQRDSSQHQDQSVTSAAASEGFSVIINTNEIRKPMITDKTIGSNAPMKLIKRSLLTDNSIRFNDGLRYEDIAFGLLLTMYAQKVYLLHDKLYHYCVNEESTVLKKNESYHTDLIKNWDILWEDLKNRGFFENFKDELELEFVYSCVIIFWKIMAFRFDEPPYSLYVLLSQKVKRYIPDILDNPYIRNNRLSELHLLLLGCCLQDLDEASYDRVISNIRKLGL